MTSMCSVSGKCIYSATQVDPSVQNSCLRVSPQEDDYQYPELKPSCAEMCLPLSRSSESSKLAAKQIFRESLKPSLQSVCEPFAPRPSTKTSPVKSSLIPQGVGLNRLLMLILGFCLPIGGPCGQENSQPCKPMLVCLPNQPILPKEDKCEEEEIKPVGLITRIKEADFIGGKFIAGCTCGRKNGLQGDCPRISCRDNPGCSMNPPRCWPQFKEPPKPVIPPDQKMVCVPIELVYYDPDKKS